MPPCEPLARVEPAGAGRRAARPGGAFRMVWFALAGPALVVVAGAVTMVDRLPPRRRRDRRAAARPATRGAGLAAATAPALQARNHAATPPADARPAMTRRALQILWPAFLAAGVLDALTFAVVDPDDMRWFGGAADRLAAADDLLGHLPHLLGRHRHRAAR